MKIRLIQSTVIKGCPGASVGQVIDAPESVAMEAISLGVAVFSNAEPESVREIDPVVETRDPQPAKKRSKSALP